MEFSDNMFVGINQDLQKEGENGEKDQAEQAHA